VAYETEIAKAEKGIERYLAEMEKSGAIGGEYLRDARQNVARYLRQWMEDPNVDRLSPNLKQGLADVINRADEEDDWTNIVNAFARKVKFGTGGIRALMGFDKESIVKLKEIGIDAPILKGENTINNMVLLRAAYGIARWLRQRDDGGGTPKAVVGCDSRIQGLAFARAIAEVFLSEGLEVSLFDQPVPYPEVTYAVPTLEADIGMFISASHNDYRYNGFKLSGPNGAQISISERDEIVEIIDAATFAEIHPVALSTLEKEGHESLERLHYLGGAEKLDRDEGYYGRDLVNIHDGYIAQIRGLFLMDELLGAGRVSEELGIDFAAFNGAGRSTVPNILDALGFPRVYSIQSLFEINGLFPQFKSDPGEEQQPDPGDPRAAEIALRELRKEEGTSDDYIGWSDADLLVGTDPDADRCGVIVHPPDALAELLTDEHRPRYSPEHTLIPADDMWTLLVWYRLTFGDLSAGEGKPFIALSHTTTDSLVYLAKKHGLGVMKTWVGFAWLSAAVRKAWAGEVPPGLSEGRSKPDQEQCDLVFYDTTDMTNDHRFNVATMEQSNGFSILGSPPETERGMGVGGHVLDKDGTLAALLTTEIASYARREGTDILSLLARHIYADDDIGLFVTYYEPDPLDGEYPGLQGETKKRGILDKAGALHEAADEGGVEIGGRAVTRTSKYWTGKYDEVNGPGFPDEGLRFYFEDDINHLTIRPSGTTNSLRFHVQLYGGVVKDESVAWKRRLELEAEARDMVTEIRERIGAPRQENVKY